MTEQGVAVALIAWVVGKAPKSRREVHERGDRLGLLREVKVCLRCHLSLEVFDSLLEVQIERVSSYGIQCSQ
jgi:hypothetical protein